MKFAAAQLNSHDDVTKNLADVATVVARAKAEGAECVVLPENFAFMGGTDEERRTASEALDGDGPIVSTLRRLAREHGVTIVGGGFPERTGDPARPHNTALVVAPSGDVVAAYRKIHLFDVDVSDGQTYRESAAVTAGNTTVVVDIGGLRVGLSICYDLRFPELYRRLVAEGAEVLLVPAAFTLTTGKDHWHALLRARAIENQCWVVAAAQWGKHPKGRQTYGKSLVIDPWGDVVAQAEEGAPTLALATLRKERVAEVRRAMPCGAHRRL